MNYVAFQKVREHILGDRADVINCAETNLYAALARLIPPPAPASDAIVHRCDLATEWVQRFGFSPEMARRALVSCGVRDSLGRLFRCYADMKARLWLPADNYPVYGEIARSAGLLPLEFPTLPAPMWPNAKPGLGIELLLVTNPLKPLGRWLTTEEVAALRTWLAAGAGRRLLLDAVYTFDTRFHPTTLELFATGQTILLHSLTKGWLQPRLFGVALVPESDATTLAPAFRVQSPPQPNLARARHLVSGHPTMPTTVGREIVAARRHLISAMPEQSSSLSDADAPGYFMPVARHWSDLLADANVLGLPATVFGSERDDITIVSSLSFLG